MSDTAQPDAGTPAAGTASDTQDEPIGPRPAGVGKPLPPKPKAYSLDGTPVEAEEAVGPQPTGGGKALPPMPKQVDLDGVSLEYDADSVVDEFGFTRERPEDDESWRHKEEAPVEVVEDDSEKERAARMFRILFHVGTVTGALLTLVAAVFHFASLGPGWVATIYVFFATACVLLSAYAFPHARFKEPIPEGGPGRLAEVRKHRQFVLRVFGIAFAVGFFLLFLLEVAALVVAVRSMSLAPGSVLLARHFVLVPVVVIALLIGALYARTRMPSRLEPEKHTDLAVAVAAGVFTFATILACFFSLGIPAVVARSGIEPRQSIYIAGVGLMAAVAVVNLRLAFPNVVRIVQEELRLAKEVDRSAAQTMQRRMMRNYILAIAFVVASIAFIGTVATGLVRPGGSGGLDVVLLVYLGVGLVFLGVVAVNFVQARRIGERVILNPKGHGPGKRRFRPEEIQRYSVMAVGAGLAVILLIVMLLVSTGTLSQVGGLALIPSDGTDFFVFAILFGVGPFAFFWARESRRVKGIDEKFPDFLRDLAESQRAGMTLPRALVTAARGAYGPLTKEIQIMASQVEWGVSFNSALERFAQRTRTPLINRTVSLITEAAASGGNVVDILTAASDDAREIKNIMTERKQQMAVYSMIVYIAFGVFLTVIAVLNSQFIPELAAATAGVGGGASVGGIQFGEIDVAVYQRIFFHAALIQGIGGGLVSGVMTDGHPFAGLKHSMIMMMIAYMAFRFLIM